MPSSCIPGPTSPARRRSRTAPACCSSPRRRQSLVYAKAPSTQPSQLYSQFLKLNIAHAVAKSADVFEIDAQGNEQHPSEYAAFVERRQRPGDRGPPGIELLAGLSTNPNGHKQTAQKLLNSA